MNYFYGVCFNERVNNCSKHHMHLYHVFSSQLIGLIGLDFSGLIGISECCFPKHYH